MCSRVSHSQQSATLILTTSFPPVFLLGHEVVVVFSLITLIAILRKLRGVSWSLSMLENTVSLKKKKKDYTVQTKCDADEQKQPADCPCVTSFLRRAVNVEYVGLAVLSRPFKKVKVP